MSSRTPYFLRRLLIEVVVGIGTVLVLLLIVGGISRYSDFVAVHFGWFIVVSFGTVWAIRIGRDLSKLRNKDTKEPLKVAVDGPTREPTILAGSQVTDLLAELFAMPILSLVPIFFFALIQIVRFGNADDYVILVVGSCLSGAAICGYGFIPLYATYKGKLDRGKKSWPLTFLALAGFIPYAFGCYLIFYKGLWGLKDLFAKFSIARLFARVMFAILGYWLVYSFYLVTEFVESAAKKEIILK
jgi:hypothetical protein